MVVDTRTSIPSAGKLISPLQSCWWQNICGQQVPEQHPSGRDTARVPHHQLPLAEATAAPGVGLNPCPQPEELLWPCVHSLGSCSGPSALLITRSPNSQWPSRCVGNSGLQGGY